MKYTALPTTCDLSVTSLQEAALIVGPAFVYDLKVSPSQLLRVTLLMKSWLADVLHNPLVPYINVQADERYSKFEWSLHANDLAAGSGGVA